MRSQLLLILLVCISASGSLVDLQEAESVAAFRIPENSQITNTFTITSRGTESLLAYVFELHPQGYVVTSADTDLPPVIAYSYANSCRSSSDESSPLIDMVRADMTARTGNLHLLPEEYRETNREEWRDLTSGAANSDPLEQWPPEGSSPTEGWLRENWTQGSPYNMYCPLDLTTNNRSVAGCPAVAMGSILNFLECTNGTRFDDNDDYYHNYNEYYWIDDDYLTRDFPSWPELNILLDTLEAHYASNHITDSDKGAIVYASGAACKQVYTSSISGTFGVEQAFDAYIRFGFSECELLYDDADSLYLRMADNMMDAMPMHLAIIDEVPQYGHNVVVDGYNTDEFFHINFGWGGSSNGWYQFPLTGMPYGMNIIEGIVLDIGEPLQSVHDSQGFSPAIRIAAASNPVSAQASVLVSVAETAAGTLAVYTVDGRVVTRQSIMFHQGTSSHSIDQLSPGIYILRAATGQWEDTLLLTVL